MSIHNNEQTHARLQESLQQDCKTNEIIIPFEKIHFTNTARKQFIVVWLSWRDVHTT